MYLNEKKKTIAHVVCSFPPNKDGTGNSAYEITKNLAQKGYDITVFTPHRVSGIGYPMSDGFEVKRLKPLFKIGNAAFLPQLIWYLRKFDIVHLHYPFYGAAEFIILAKILNPKIKLIIHYHQDAVGNDFKKLIFKSYQWLILPILVRLAHYITCATLSYIKQSELGGYYKKHPEKFRQTYFGVNYKQCKNHIIPHRGNSK